MLKYSRGIRTLPNISPRSYLWRKNDSSKRKKIEATYEYLWGTPCHVTDNVTSFVHGLIHYHVNITRPKTILNKPPRDLCCGYITDEIFVYGKNLSSTWLRYTYCTGKKFPFVDIADKYDRVGKTGRKGFVKKVKLIWLETDQLTSKICWSLQPKWWRTEYTTHHRIQF